MNKEIICECDNCGALWPENELDEIKDFVQRVSPGEIVPYGQCPNCGALCHAHEASPPEPMEQTLEAARDELCRLVLIRTERRFRVGGAVGVRHIKRGDEALMLPDAPDAVGGVLYVVYAVRPQDGGGTAMHVADNLEDAYDFLKKSGLVEKRHYAVNGRIPGDDDDSLLAISVWPWESVSGKFARTLYDTDSNAKLPLNFEDVSCEGTYGTWFYENGHIEFGGPPL